MMTTAARHRATNVNTAGRHSFVTIFALSLLVSIFGETLAYTEMGYWGIVFVSITVLALILTKKRVLAVCLLFLTTLNISEFSRNIYANLGYYSMRTVMLMGVSLSVWLLALAAGTCIVTRGWRLLANGFVRFLLFTMLWFVVVGSANCLWGRGSWSYFLADVQPPVTILLSYVSVRYLPAVGRRWMVSMITAAVLGRPLATVLARLLHLGGSYAGLEIWTYAPLSFFGVALLALLFVGRQNSMPRWIVWPCALAELYVLTIQPSGKDFFTLAIVIVVVLGTAARTRHGVSASKVVGVALVGALLVLVFGVVFSQGDVSPLASRKVNEAIALLTAGPRAIAHPELAYEMPPSVGLRILETANIAADLAKSPSDLLFGRGAGGAFSDWRYPLPLVGAAYSLREWTAGRFYAVHESLSFVLLKFGVVGLLGWIVVLGRLLRLLRRQHDAQHYLIVLCTLLTVLVMLSASIQIYILLGAALALEMPDVDTRLTAASALRGGGGN